MNSFHRPRTGLQETEAQEEEVTRSPLTEIAGRFANWMTGSDRLTLDEAAMRPEPENREPAPEVPAPVPEAPRTQEDTSRFPLAPFGYNRAAVDEHLATLERELDQVRSKREPLSSITDELERLGEQTASILVVAHDQAHETTRLAQEQADRCVADAAANAVAMTEQAKHRLRDLDNETDAIWRERERLLEDVRVVSAALANLADQASDRFPAAEPAAPAAAAFPAVGAAGHRGRPGLWEQTAEAEPAMFPMRPFAAPEPQATEPFDAIDASGEDGMPTQPGDTGNWPAGLEPPELYD